MKSLIVTAGIVLSLISHAEAKARHHHHHFRLHHDGVRHHYAHRRCDGFHGCRCGVTAARNHGLPLEYHGHNLKQAVEWRRAFPRSYSPAPGNVVYQHGGGPTGHVSTIARVIDRCTAVVSDDRGTYERNVCSRGAVILAVGG